MAIQSQPSRISEPFAGSGTKNVIPATNTTPSASQAASWASGFPPECSQPISAGGCPVPRNDMNGVLNQMSQDYSFRQDGGVWEWSGLADYDTQRMVRGSDGLLYYSKAQSGPSIVAGAQDPTLDTAHAYWDQVPTDNGDVVHRTGDEIIDGVKNFTGSTTVFSQAVVNNGNSDIITPTEAANSYFVFRDKNNVEMSALQNHLTVGSNEIKIMCRTIGDSSTALSSLSYVGFEVDTGDVKSFHPSNASILLGNSGTSRWAQLYATTATINTSDERAKTSISPIPDDVLDAWDSVGFVQYQYKTAFFEKGADARLHSGLIAQRIDEAFKARGLDASRYGLFCHDIWGASPAELDEEGKTVRPAIEAGDEFSLRYEEALCMEAAYQRRRADRAEARIVALEERLAAIEAKLG